MKAPTWFSSRIRYAVIAESHGLQSYMDSVRLFRSTDFDSAFSRVLEIGLSDQKEYLNADGERIAWRLVSIISLDLLSPQLVDGQEVYSEPVEVEDGTVISFDTVLNPALSSPTQTI
ncbi:MAG: DUF4288 domain-containing protein [Acidobacteriaceae bacterium]|nr:DUF4288 domain-containing protein [Acidobacteriaceae bacterium]